MRVKCPTGDKTQFQEQKNFFGEDSQKKAKRVSIFFYLYSGGKKRISACWLSVDIFSQKSAVLHFSRGLDKKALLWLSFGEHTHTKEKNA